MKMTDTIEKVFKVYGNDLPEDRDLYQATVASPVTMLELRKEFGSYEKFKQAYLARIIEKRNEVKTTTKGAKKDAKK
jgi:hypothetical protein